jgi:hypothetical protein
MKISRVRKAPRFPHQKGISISSFFQLLIGIFIWILMIILFVIGAWAAWFGRSLSYLLGKNRNVVPWWFSWMCILLVFPIPIITLVILVAEFAKIVNTK